MRRRSIPCPAIAAWARCGSATRPTARCSTTSTARPSSPPLTCSSTAGWFGAATRSCSAGWKHSGTTPPGCSTSRTRDCGSCAAHHACSSVMCWAGCDRLARIAAHLGLAERAAHWAAQAARIHQVICDRCWSVTRGSFVATMGGDTLDASLLRLNELGFLSDDDPRFAGTVSAIERELRRGDFIFRYVEQDDFGTPVNALLVCI